ncbi:MAG: hypothetical protein QOE03_2899 [Micromonosporaceae bacterium]|nr:hypothetical protein [Micromonosporaceae bacterium]
MFGTLRVLIPDLDPRDLDATADPPDDDLDEAMVDGADWSGRTLAGAGIRRSHLLGVTLTDATWRNVRLYGCRFDRVDFSGSRLDGLTIERCEFVGCRMTGVQLADSTLKNVVFDDCRLDYAGLADVRASGPVAWAGCTLANAVLTDCRLPAAVFADCRLAGLELNDCQLGGADLRGNDLSGISGLLSLREATVAASQLGDLAALAVRELDITVVEGPPVVSRG